MSPELQAALAEAYNLDQVQRNRPGALRALQAAFASTQVLDEAQAEAARLSDVVSKRSSQACHISNINSTLLAAALAAPLAGH